MKPIRLWRAAHEAGHAVARLVLDEELDYPGPAIKTISLRDDLQTNTIGTVWYDARCRSGVATRYQDDSSLLAHKHLIQRDIRLDIVEGFAGPVAEALARMNFLATMSMVHDMTKAILASKYTPGHEDGYAIQARLDWLACAHPQQELEHLSRAAICLIYSEWPGVLAAARVLRDQIEMEGVDFEATWRANRLNDVRRANRRIRAGFPSVPRFIETWTLRDP